jgi:tetratricopeptide (TPR) repeat protein
VRARDSYLRAIEIDPKDPTVRMALAKAYLRLPTMWRQRGNFEEALKISPDLREAKNSINDIKKILGETITEEKAPRQPGRRRWSRVLLTPKPCHCFLLNTQKKPEYDWMSVGIAEA